MHVAANRVVTIEYTLTDQQGQVLDSSDGGEPLHYLQGHQNIIPGLEMALEGKQVGEQFTVTISPEDGYGLRDDALCHAVPREMFEDSQQIEVGMQFQTPTDQGVRIVTVVALSDEEVTVDANHPLAGAILTFAVKVVDIREASAEECAHGHVHHPGHAHHGH